MISPLQRKRIDYLNSILLEGLGSYEGIPRYKWEWSENLQIPMVILDDQEEPQPIKEYVCGCGVDRRVHEPSCTTLTIVRFKAQMRRLLPDPKHKNCWVLTALVAPGFNEFPSENEWSKTFGSAFPFPRNGYYIPVSDSVKQVVIKQGELPSLELTTKIMRFFWEQAAETEEQRQKDMAREEIERMGKKKDELEYSFRQLGPVGDDTPGTKSNFIIVPGGN